jgi:uncharacterized protein YbbC (DUF1343 family)
MKKALFFFVSSIIIIVACTSALTSRTETANKIIPGADQTEKYLPYLKGRKIGIMANQSSLIGNRSSIDTLHALGINIVKIFGPEHGFRGHASAGDAVTDEVDSATGIPVISLYGKINKPTPEHLKGINLMIFDLQDVGTRFFTTNMALKRVMEACAENGIELMIFDRPNPNGYFIDGPILEDSLKSGIGGFPIPITHGLTMGEFAQMINGQGWLKGGIKCKLNIIKVANYSHDMPYELPVKPSPNLNTVQSILLYPSTCLFEGTYLNHGRGTYFPFTVLGAPSLKGKYSFSYTPVGIKGMAETPLYMNQVCYGLDLRNYDTDKLRQTKQINIQWMKELYAAFPEKEKFFDSRLSNQMGNIDRLAGTANFRKQIIAGVPEAEIRKSWEPGLSQYKEMRKKYLLYP